MAAPLVAARRLAMDAERVISDLRELDRRTGGPDGARRVCWSEPWEQARAFLRERLAALPVTVDVDEAGNLWAQLAGEGDAVVVVGSHLDSVPGGGWLDGALGVFAALEVLRTAGRPAVTLRLVDWADEEGRFGRSLFGSSACAGTLDPDAVRDLRDRDGVRLEDAVGIDLDHAGAARGRLAGVRGLSRAAHRAGSGAREPGRLGRRRPGHLRRRAPCRRLHRPGRARGRDADGDAARQLRRGRAGCTGDPPDRVRARGCLHGRRRGQRTRDRHRRGRADRAAPGPAPPRPGSLAAMLAAARAACEQAAADHGCEVELQPVWSIPAGAVRRAADRGRA